MKRFAIYWTIALSFALALGSCAEEKDKKDFFNAHNRIMFELAISGDSAATQERIDSILDLYGFTQKSFDEYYDKTLSEPEIFLEALDSAKAFARRERTRLEDLERKYFKDREKKEDSLKQKND